MPRRPPTHRPPGADAARTSHQQQYDRDRRSLPHRKLYLSAAWQRFRLSVLADRPTCEDCRQCPASQVHHPHKLSQGGHLCPDPAEVMALCAGCHAIRTRRGE